MYKKLKGYFYSLFPTSLFKREPYKDAYQLACKLGLFDLTWYEERYGKFATPIAAFNDYITKSHFANINPSQNFDTETYFRQNLSVYHSGESPLLHYLYRGRYEGENATPSHLRWHPKKVIVAKDSLVWNKQKIAICLHIYYADFVEKLAVSIKTFPCDVDVFVAVANEDIKLLTESIFSALKPVKQLKVVIAPNQGRNFGPLLVEFGKDLLKYDLMCHVHSKKSLYSGREQTQWFDYLNQFLLKDLHVLSCLLRLFASNPKLGMYYPTSFWMMPSWVNHWTCNKAFASDFTHDWDIDITENFINYPVGGMFWARPSALKQLFEKEYSYENFPEEPLPNDGSWLHALERSVGLLVEKNKYEQFYYHPSSSTFTTDKSYIFANYYKTPSRFFDEVRNFEVVSFDVFDTVVRREFTEPDYAKLKVGQFLDEQNQIASANAFVLLRNQVEFELRKKNGFQGDVNIVEIYELLAEHLDCDIEQAYSYMQLEFEYDLAQIQAKDEMVNLVYQLADLGREIWFITDTYYTQAQVQTILRAIGINIAYRLYVSSELKLRKDSGTMWKFIRDETRKLGGSYIHIGDNVRSDAQICGDFGLANMHVLHPIDKWQAAGFEPFLTKAKSLDEKAILKWGKLVSNFGRYPFFGE